MFGFKKEKKSELMAVVDGTVIELTEVPDPVFAGKIVGDGCAIIPTGNKIVSPVNGIVVTVMDTLHAYCIEGEDGVNFLIHIGLDTVNLKGEGFKSFVKVGDTVKVGDLIAEADLEFISSKGYKLHTPIIILDMDKVTDCKCVCGEAKSGKSVAMTYKLN